MAAAELSRRVVLRSLGLAAGGVVVARHRCARANSKRTPSNNKKELVSRLQGVHNFLTTPFLSNYKLDADGLYRNVLVHAQANPEKMVVVVAGGLGELFSLSTVEHEELVHAAVRGARGKVPVVAGVGGGYGNALAMARNAQKAGVDAILIFASPRACDGVEGPYHFLRDVANSVEIGALAYPCGNSDAWPELLARLAELPNLVGFKDASGDVKVGRALGPLVGEEFLWVAEGEAHAEKTLAAGAGAFTTAVATFVPQGCLEFWRQGTSGNADTMKRVRQQRIAPVVKLRTIKPGYGISGIKVALESLGRAGGPVRPPQTQVAYQDRAAIAEIARTHAETLL